MLLFSPCERRKAFAFHKLSNHINTDSCSDVSPPIGKCSALLSTSVPPPQKNKCKSLSRTYLCLVLEFRPGLVSVRLKQIVREYPGLVFLAAQISRPLLAPHDGQVSRNSREFHLVPVQFSAEPLSAFILWSNRDSCSWKEKAVKTTKSFSPPLCREWRQNKNQNYLRGRKTSELTCDSITATKRVL